MITMFNNNIVLCKKNNYLLNSLIFFKQNKSACFIWYHMLISLFLKSHTNYIYIYFISLKIVMLKAQFINI